MQVILLAYRVRCIGAPAIASTALPHRARAHATMPHDGGRLAVRLDVLSREQLLALAAAGCATDARLCARADALIAEANPLHRALLHVHVSMPCFHRPTTSDVLREGDSRI